MNCSKCGAGVPQGAAFCPMCGTPAVPTPPIPVAPPAPPVPPAQTIPSIPVPTPPPAPSPAQAAAPAPAVKTKMPVWGIILIVIACVFLLIALLGIASGIVLASLGNARGAASDAKIKMELSSLRTNAELYKIDHEESYEGVCESSEFTSAQDNAYTTTNIDTATGKITTEAGEARTSLNLTCNDSTEHWAASAPLSTGMFYCVDGEGSAQKVSKALTTEVQCPAN